MSLEHQAKPKACVDFLYRATYQTWNGTQRHLVNADWCTFILDDVIPIGSSEHGNISAPSAVFIHSSSEHAVALPVFDGEMWATQHYLIAERMRNKGALWRTYMSILWLTFRFRKCFLLLLSLLDFNDNFWSLLPSHQTPFSVHCLHNVNATTTVFPRLRTHSFDHSAHARMTCLFLTCLFLPGDGRSWSSQWSGRPSWHWSESSRKVPACTWVAARTAGGGRGGWALPVLLLPYDSTWGKKWWRTSLGLISGVATLSKSINVVKQRKNDFSLESAAFLITYRNKKQQQ